MPPANPRIGVFCIKWGTAYPAEHVNILYRAVADHLSLPFEFICITDDDTGLLPQVQTRPFSFPNQPASEWISGMWPKLQVFKPALTQPYDVVLYLDLDLLVTGQLEPLIEHCWHGGGLWMMSRGTYLWWRWLPERWQPKRGGNSSVLIFRPADQNHLYDTFSVEADVSRFGNDQNYVYGLGEEVRLLSEKAAVSFKAGCVPTWPGSLLRPEIKQPAGATFIIFHGHPKPADLANPQVGRWGRKWRQGQGAIFWVQQYWQRYSVT